MKKAKWKWLFLIPPIITFINITLLTVGIPFCAVPSNYGPVALVLNVWIEEKYVLISLAAAVCICVVHLVSFFMIQKKKFLFPSLSCLLLLGDTLITGYYFIGDLLRDQVCNFMIMEYFIFNCLFFVLWIIAIKKAKAVNPQ